MEGWRRRSAEARLERWRCCFGGVLLIVCLLTDGPAGGVEPGRGPPSDTGPPVDFPAQPSKPAIAESRQSRTPATAAPVESGETDRWHQNLVRERIVEVRLRNARREIESGHLVGGLTAVQSILDRDDDVFIRSADEPVPRGAHSLAERLLASVSPRSQGTYETLYGPEARKLLEAARARPDGGLLARVVRRFYYTAAGFEAGNRLAAWWTDHGCDDLAWGWWQRVLNEPAHEARVTGVLRVQAALCGHRLGRADEARALLEQLDGAQSVSVGGRRDTIERWQDRLSTPDTLRLADRDAGAAMDSTYRGGSPPALARALWRNTLAGEQSRHIAALARTWEAYQVQNGLPVGTGQLPLLVGTRLIYRDFESLRAVDVASGQGAWCYPCASSLSREIAPRQIVATDGNPDSNNVMRHLVGNCVLGTLTSDGRHVFAVDGIESDEPAPATAPPTTGEAAAPPRLCNRLLSFDLAGAAGQVEPRWTVGGRVAEGTPARPLAGHYFLGPPLAVDDRLFAASEANQQLHLSCITAATGTVINGSSS